MQDENSKSSLWNRIKSNRRSIAMCSVSVVAGGAVVLCYYKYRRVLTICNVDMDQINFLKENGQGVISFELNPKDIIWFALPDKV
jgi:hypothetical protein